MMIKETGKNIIGKIKRKKNRGKNNEGNLKQSRKAELH